MDIYIQDLLWRCGREGKKSLMSLCVSGLMTYCLGGCVLQRCGGFASRCVKCNRLPAFTSTAYKEKVKEISVLSLICSCLYPETRKNIMGDFEGQTLNCSSYITKKI